VDTLEAGAKNLVARSLKTASLKIVLAAPLISRRGATRLQGRSDW
jgi:hypothetical protein